MRSAASALLLFPGGIPTGLLTRELGTLGLLWLLLLAVLLFSGGLLKLLFSLILHVELFGNRGEDFLNVETGLGRSLETFVDAALSCEFLCTLEGHFSLLFHLCLVAYQVDSHILTCVLLNFFEPFHKIHEGVLACHIIGEENAMRTTVEDTGDRLEGLLAGCVPDLQLDNLAPVYFQTERPEFDTDSDLMLNLELVVHDSLHEATLADTGISNNDQLEQVVLRRQCLVRNDLVAHSLDIRIAYPLTCHLKYNY